MSWTIWTLGHLILPENLRIITLIIGAFGPFSAAIIIIRISKEKSDLKKWLRGLFNFRIHILWYVLAGIVLPFLIAAIHHLIDITMEDLYKI